MLRRAHIVLYVGKYFNTTIITTFLGNKGRNIIH